MPHAHTQTRARAQCGRTGDVWHWWPFRVRMGKLIRCVLCVLCVCARACVPACLPACVYVQTLRPTLCDNVYTGHLTDLCLCPALVCDLFAAVQAWVESTVERVQESNVDGVNLDIEVPPPHARAHTLFLYQSLSLSLSLSPLSLSLRIYLLRYSVGTCYLHPTLGRSITRSTASRCSAVTTKQDCSQPPGPNNPALW